MTAIEPLTAIPRATGEFRRVARERSDFAATEFIAVAPTSANVWLNAMQEIMGVEGVDPKVRQRVIATARQALADLHAYLGREADLWQSVVQAVASIDNVVQVARDQTAGTTFKVDA